MGELHDGRAFREQSLAGLLKLVLRLGQPAFERRPSRGGISEVRVARGRFPSEQFRQLRFAPRQPLGCGGRFCRSILPGLLERRGGIARAPLEGFLDGRSLREARLTLRFCVRQSGFDRFTRGDFL